MGASRKLKILYTNAMYSPDIGGGAEIMLKAMAEGMQARGHEVHVLTTHSAPSDRIDEVDGITVHRLKLRNLYWPHAASEQPHALKKAAWHAIDSANYLMAPIIRAKLKAIQPDVLISHNMPGFGLGLWREAHALNIPIIQVLHDYYLICPRSTLFKNGQSCSGQCCSCRVFRSSHPDASNLVTAVVGVSHAILQTHLEHGLFANTPIKQTIYNARALPEPKHDKVKGPQDTVTFGFIGALSEVKGIKELIAAFQQLLKTHGNARLLVAGNGKPEFVQELRQMANSPMIEFLGRVDALEFFTRIDYCVAPSTWRDPFPGVVYEAISQNVPVIGSKAGGIPEVIQEGVNGTLFQITDSSALTNKLLEAVKKPRAASCGSIRHTVNHLLNEVRMHDAYEHLLYEVKKFNSLVTA